MTTPPSERTNPAAYRARLTAAAVRYNLDAESVSGESLNWVAVGAELEKPTEASREVVATALEGTVDFTETCSQDAAQELFDAAADGRPIVVVTADGRKVVLAPVTAD
ncbi:hypothetical protein [Streptomyces sp. MN6]